ncbi:MAG TPA: hypothetical protein VFQ27_10510 [Xanthobacteraceae bacterium]|nr:hypothetical protein [Xanthobacteraceae bacterium]
MGDYIATMNSDHRHTGEPEWPRSEPEIIPPARARERQDEDVFVFIRGEGRRATFAPPGPLSFVLAFVIAGLLLAGILLLAFGIIVIVVPVVAVTAAALIGYLYLRGALRRLQRRPTR